MRVLLDTNVVIDAFLHRAPWDADARIIVNLHQEERIVGFVSAASIPTMFYIGRKLAGSQRAWQAVDLCLRSLEVGSTNRDELVIAARMGGADFEDNLQIACAVANSANAIVTRDKTGFKHAPCAIFTPSEFLQHFASSKP